MGGTLQVEVVEYRAQYQALKTGIYKASPSKVLWVSVFT